MRGGGGVRWGGWLTVVLPSEAKGAVLDAVALSDGLVQVVGHESLRDDLLLQVPDLDGVAHSSAQPATKE